MRVGVMKCRNKDLSGKHVSVLREKCLSFFKILTLFRMDIFGAAYGWGERKGPPSQKSVSLILQ